MIFLNNDIQSKSSIEETDNFASDVAFPAFIMGEDALGGGKDKMSELSGGKNVVCPLLKVREKNIIPW